MIQDGILVRLTMSNQALRKRFTHLVLPGTTPPGPAASLLLSLIRKHYDEQGERQDLP